VPFRSYSTPEKLEAIALAEVIGAEAAGEQLGMKPLTIRKWMAASGDRPELRADSITYRAIRDLAKARALLFAASAKLTPAQAITLAAVGDRNLRYDPKAPASTSALAVGDVFDEWVSSVHLAPLIHTEADLDSALDVIPALRGHLLREANAESDDPGNHPTPHRTALLAWHSGRTVDTAGQPISAPEDLLDWATAITAGLVTMHGDLISWCAHDRARRAAERAVRWTPPLPDDLAALVAEADRLLEEMSP
jgi:hypothetical protein